MVDSVVQVEGLVCVVCYLLVGVCGVGSVLVWVLCWNSVVEYLNYVDEQMCLLVQVENLEGLVNFDVIVVVEGVDGVFIGLVDFSVVMGYCGNLGYFEVQVVIEDVIYCICMVGKVVGIFFVDEILVWCYLELGCVFVVVGVDISLLMCLLCELVGCFKGGVLVLFVSFLVYG